MKKSSPIQFRAESIRLLTLGATVAILAGCSKAPEGHHFKEADLPPVSVRTQTVQEKKSPMLEEVVGTVRAKLHATMEAKTSGRIAEMPVFLGQKIKAAELLARLDAPEIKARLEQADAGLLQAEREWKRVSSLLNQQAATRADYDAADSRYLIAKAAVAEARAMMGYVEIRAPFDGVVTRKWADVGDLAAPGKPLVELEDPTRLQIEADVPETMAVNIKPEGRLAVRFGQDSAELAATVAEIAPNADPTSRTFQVKLDLPSQDPALRTPHSAVLRSGQFARLVVPVGEFASMRIPASAVVQRGQLEIVFVAENQRAQLHLVKTGRKIDGETEILSGLDSGDTVVIDNASQLVDGQPLQVK